MRIAISLLFSFILLTSTLSAQPANQLGSRPFDEVIRYLANRYLGVTAPAPATAVLQSAANQVNQTRSDQHVTAPPGAAASISVVEKAGIADILAIAIERGAIMKTSKGGAVTLSTTPYAWLLAFGTPDTNGNWQKHSRGRRLSISSTFATEDVTEGDFSSFSSAEIKYVFHGHRSLRDIANVADLRGVKEIVDSINAADAHQFTSCTNPLLNALGERGTRALMTDVSTAALDPIFADYEPDADVLQTLKDCTASITTQAEVDRRVRSRLNTILADYLKNSKRFQLSAAGLFTRDPDLSDFYTVKILADYNPAAGTSRNTADSATPMWTANFNGVVNFNQRNNTTDGRSLRQVRSFSVEVAGNTRRFGQNRLDATVSAKGEKAKDFDAKSLVVSAGRLNVHLNDTLTLPVSVSYASRETDTVKKGFQFNIGVSALLDKLMSQVGSR